MPFVDYTSELKRKQWMREGLIQAKTVSFWSPFTAMHIKGKETNAVVIQVNNLNADAGHTIIFDYDGNLRNKPVKGKETAYGKGEKKRKFKNSLTVNRYRYVVDNGDSFDGVDIGDLSITQHEDSRSKLSDLFMRNKDQMINDCVQGIKGSAPTHIINLGSTFGYDSLIQVEEKVRTGQGFTTGSTRSPLKPYMLADKRKVWLFVVDSFMAGKLKQDSKFQNIMSAADVRGNDNRVIQGVLGQIGSLLIIENSTFFGESDVASGLVDVEDTAVEIAGFRRKDANNKWTGYKGYTYTGQQTSRGVVLGANAVQFGFGKMPDYKLQKSQDFEITSESCLETWLECQKTILEEELHGDYAAAKVANIDFGIIAVDVITQPAS